jgi:hypothetical protein
MRHSILLRRSRRSARRSPSHGVPPRPLHAPHGPEGDSGGCPHCAADGHLVPTDIDGRKGWWNQDREPEVGHHEPRSEMVETGETAKRRLGDDAERQQHRDPGEIAPVWTPGEREHGRDHGDDPDDRRDRPVSELDQGVRAERRQRGPPAFRPVRAAEPGIGEPDRSPVSTIRVSAISET